MIVTHKISMDLVRRSVPCIEAVQDDRYSRDLQIRLTANGLPFSPPADCTVEVRFTKSDGRTGRYDTMPDGTAAWVLQDDLLTVRLAPQVLTAAGEVSMMVALNHQDAELNCFPIRIMVVARPNLSVQSSHYVNVTRFLPQPSDATEPGMYLRVDSVDEQGRVTAISGVGPASVGQGPAGNDGGYYTPAVQNSGNTMVVSYVPSKENMPPVPSQTVTLPQGKDGVSGVYIGTVEPTDSGVNVWIDPEGGDAGINPVVKTDSMTLDVGVDGNGRLFVDTYTKNHIDQALSTYIDDVNALIGGDS